VIPVPDARRRTPWGLLKRFSLEGKVAVITGASSGLGVAFAKGFAEAGADVALGARRTDRLHQTQEVVEAAGRRAISCTTDVTRPEDCQALVDAAMDAFGRVDVLINNAGVAGENTPVGEDDPEQFRSVMDINVNGTYWMAQACSRVMQPGSSILNLSSVAAVRTLRQPASAYSASKAAVLGLTRDLAAQLAPKGIRVNAVLPGMFPSEQTMHYSDNYKRKIIEAKIPIGREGDPEELAAVAVFVTSEASAYVTGASLPVEGGLLLV
jgi:NAD(P)-dependent dehydrogenase (short-subunit alcohol dehydrogenase family)